MTLTTGKVEKVEFTSGGAGNQWTTINGTRYATWWDIRTKNWKTGDQVSFRVYRATLWAGMVPINCADSFRRVEEG